MDGASDFQRALFADGRLTFAEYEGAILSLTQCFKDHGITIVELNLNARNKYEMAIGLVPGDVERSKSPTTNVGKNTTLLWSRSGSKTSNQANPNSSPPEMILPRAFGSGVTNCQNIRRRKTSITDGSPTQTLWAVDHKLVRNSDWRRTSGSRTAPLTHLDFPPTPEQYARQTPTLRREGARDGGATAGEP
jgi:hypothetical protein